MFRHRPQTAAHSLLFSAPPLHMATARAPVFAGCGCHAPIVGYTSATTGADNNFRVIPFCDPGYNTSDIQQLTLNDGGADSIGWGEENFSIWEGVPTVVGGSEFIYYDPTADLTGTEKTYYWGDSNANKVTYPIAPGQGVVVNCAAGLTLSIEPPYSL